MLREETHMTLKLDRLQAIAAGAAIATSLLVAAIGCASPASAADKFKLGMAVGGEAASFLAELRLPQRF